MDPKYAEKIFPKPSHYVECCLHEILSLASKCHNEIETHQNQAIFFLSSVVQFFVSLCEMQHCVSLLLLKEFAGFFKKSLLCWWYSALYHYL